MVSLAGIHSKVLVYNYVIHSVWDCSFQGQLAGNKFHQLRDMGSWPSIEFKMVAMGYWQVPFFMFIALACKKKE